MIRQIVFDMGDVLLDFDTHGAAAAFADTVEDAALLHREVLQSPWWIYLDRGGAEETALAAMFKALPVRLRPNARQLMERWDEWLIPDLSVNDLARELAGKGYGLYLLSNTSERFQRFREKLPVLSVFQGLVLSYEEKLLKPDPAFYQRLLERYGLRSEECFFVDDSPSNVECARYLGMAGHCFRTGTAALRRELRDCGVDIEP